MKRNILTLSYLIPILLTFIFICTNALAWTRNLTFESGISGSDGFSGAGSTVDRSQSQVHSGNYAARVYFRAGDRCWDSALTCGAIFNSFPERVGDGDEMWTRVYAYFPNGWDWGDQSGKGNWRKFLRYTIGTRGNISIQGVWDGGSNAQILGNTEAGNYYSYNAQFTGKNFPIGRWFSLEMYVRFGTTDATTTHRLWLDGELIFDSSNDSTNNPVLGSSSDTCTRILFFTYWNDAVRTSQYAYLDDILITTDTPSNRDSKGNPMIGPGNFSSSSNSGDNTTTTDTPQATTVETPKNLRIISN